MTAREPLLPLLPPVQAPADCWTWTDPNEVLQAALASFYGSCRLAEAPPEDGTPWLDQGQPACDRESWVDEVTEQFKLRLWALAHQKGVSQQFEFVRQLEATERLIAKHAVKHV